MPDTLNNNLSLDCKIQTLLFDVLGWILLNTGPIKEKNAVHIRYLDTKRGKIGQRLKNTDATCNIFVSLSSI